VIRAAEMRTARSLCSLLFATAVAASCTSPGGSFGCADVCGNLKSCIDTTIDLQLCSDRCDDRLDEDAELHANFDSCSSCLNGDHTCAEIQTLCSTCATVTTELSRARR
jgi:hypothetical protein